MSENNGVIRVGKKGMAKFAIGEEGKPFEVDVVATMQQWFIIHESYQQTEGEEKGKIRTEDMPAFHSSAVDFVKQLAPEDNPTTAEALHFLALLREQWDGLIDFFQPRKREKDESPGTSAEGLVFLEEPTTDSQPSTSSSSAK